MKTLIKRQQNKSIQLIRAGQTLNGNWYWLQRNSLGHQTSGILTEQHELPVSPHSGDTHLLIPSSLCSYLCVPKVDKKRKVSAQSLLWQKEEQLLTDADSLHSIIFYQDAENYYLAAVDRSYFSQILEWLHARDIYPTKAFPEIAWLAEQSGAFIEDEWIFRTSTASGTSIPDAWVNQLNNDALKTRIETLRQQPTLTLEKTLINFKAEPPAGSGFISSSFRNSGRKVPWRGIAWLIAAVCLWGLTLALKPAIDGWLLHQQSAQRETQLNEKIASLYALPADIVPIEWLKQHNGQSAVTPGLSAFITRNNDFLSQINGGAIQQMSWSQGDKRLQLLVSSSPDNLNQLAQSFSNPQRKIQLSGILQSSTVQIEIQELPNVE